jgi:ferric-dicitrate binding protein FerR (iron transport regulator)
MTTQTLFDNRPVRTLSERFENTPLDPARGRAREFRAIFWLTLLVLVAVFAVLRLARIGQPSAAQRRSIIGEARTAALAALPYAYRH